MEQIQEKTLDYKPWVTSGKTSGLVFNEKFELCLVDYIEKNSRAIQQKLPGGKRKMNTELDVLKESSESCIERELREEIFVKISEKKFAGTLIIEDERRAGFLHTKDVYVIENDQYKEIGKVHNKQVYERKFYPIDEAWDIIHKNHKSLLAIGLVCFFNDHLEIKKEHEIIAMFAEGEVMKIKNKNEHFIEKVMKK
jgi:ADP-ribose pyrophosphatase YjhB (NUDIX family)